MKRIPTMIMVTLVSVLPAYANGAAESPELDLREGFSRGEAAGVDVQWRVEDDVLTVQMAAATTGWVAVGFDPQRRMEGANFIIGYVSDGDVHVSDDYGVGPISHEPDVDIGGTDNILQAEGEERDGVTVIRFSIPLDSGDSTDRPLRAGSTYSVLVAAGPNGADDPAVKHRQRGSFQMEL